jgi:hypothetical protein
MTEESNNIILKRIIVNNDWRQKKLLIQTCGDLRKTEIECNTIKYNTNVLGTTQDLPFSDFKDFVPKKI